MKKTASMRKPKKREKENATLVAFSLPRLSLYADRPDVTVPPSGDASKGPSLALVTKTINTLLQAFEDAIQDAAEFYAGDIISTMFSTIVCRFPSVVDALDGALEVIEKLGKWETRLERGEDLDRHLISFGAHLPAAYVTEARPIGFKYATAEAHKPRVCSEEKKILEAVKSCGADGFPLPSVTCLEEVKANFHRTFEYEVVSACEKPMIRVLKRKKDRFVEEELTDEQKKQAELRRLPRDVRRTWDKFDLNKDSELSREEVHDVLMSLDYDLSEYEVDDFFDKMDEDSSGTVSVKEFADAFTGPTLGCAALTRNIKLAAKRMAAQSGVESLPLIMEMWNKYDTSGDGSLDPKELHSVLLDMWVENVTEQEVLWLFDKLDEDKSGVLELDEFSALVSSKNKSRGGYNPMKAKISTVQRAKAPKTKFATREQLSKDHKLAIQSFFDRYLIFILFFWILASSAYATFAVFARNVLPDQDGVSIMFFVLDLVYWAWFVAKFRFFPYDDRGTLITETKEVAMRYIKTPDFWIDVIVLLPLDIGYWAAGKPATIGFFRLNKVLACYYLPYAFDAVSNWITPTKAAVARTFMLFLIAAHVGACAFVEIATDVGSEATEDIFEIANVVETDNQNQRLLYLRSLYWAILCLAGQIQGDGIPQLDIHVGLSLAIAALGLPIYAMLLATISSVNDIETAENLYLQRLDRVLSYCSYFEFDEAFTEGARRYYNHVYRTTGTLTLNYELPHDMPEELEILMNIEVGKEFFSKVPIFKKVMESSSADALINELVSRMKTRIISPGTTIMKRDEESTGMAFVQEGEFLGYGEGGVVLMEARKGMFFGEIELLLGVKCLTTVVSSKEKYSNLLFVTREDFEDVMTFFPEALQTLSNQAKDRYSVILEAENNAAAKKVAQERMLLANKLKSGEINEEELQRQASLLDARLETIGSRSGSRKSIQFGKSAAVAASPGIGDLAGESMTGSISALLNTSQQGGDGGSESNSNSPGVSPSASPTNNSFGSRHLQSVSFGINTSGENPTPRGGRVPSVSDGPLTQQGLENGAPFSTGGADNSTEVTKLEVGGAVSNSDCNDEEQRENSNNLHAGQARSRSPSHDSRMSASAATPLKKDETGQMLSAATEIEKFEAPDDDEDSPDRMPEGADAKNPLAK